MTWTGNRKMPRHIKDGKKYSDPSVKALVVLGECLCYGRINNKAAYRGKSEVSGMWQDNGSVMERFFGGPPAWVVLRLAIISLILGIFLSAIGLSPFDILNSIRQLAVRIYDMGFEAVEWVVRYFLLGAVIVFPIWLVTRLFRAAGGRRHSGPVEPHPHNSDS